MGIINTRVEMDVTREEAGNISNMIKTFLHHRFYDYEHDRFFKAVTDIRIIRGDNAYLYGTTFVVGCDISSTNLERELKTVIYFHYDKMFPEEKKKKEEGSSTITGIIIIIVLIVIIRGCMGC